MSDSLAAFLEARISEDEEAARAADAVVLPGDLPRETHLVYGLRGAGFNDSYQGFALVHDPARVLRQCEAMRAILDEHEPQGSAHFRGGKSCVSCGWDDGWAGVEWPCATVRALAAVWGDHPDYRAEWKP